MSEIAAVPDNGLRIVSTFSGCGGSCLGFRMAGYRTLWASEFVDAAAATYEANFPGIPVSRADIRDVRPEDVLEAAGVDVGGFDVLEGSPPCASFSTAGRRSEHWGQVKKYSDREQRTDDLFSEYARLLRGLQPRAFVAENVAGLVKGVAKGYFKRIHQELVECGYRVEARMLNAQWLGVPQARARVIFVGVRRDLGRDPAFPAPLPYRYSIRDALPWIDVTGATGQYGNEFEDRLRGLDEPASTIPASIQGRHHPGLEARRALDIDEPCPTVQTHGRLGTFSELAVPGYGEVAEDVAPSLDGYAIGAEWDRLRPGKSSARYFNLKRPDADAPLLTVTAGGGAPGGIASVTHPTEKRKFTIAELRRLCGFPDDFVLTGTYAQQWERLGRAVPPPMMRAVAKALRDNVLS